jgi:hypothetical protein
MLRRVPTARGLTTPALAATSGIAVALAGLLGAGASPAAAATAATAAVSASDYAVQYVSVPSGPQHVLVRWAPCIRSSSGPITQVIRYKVNPAGHSARIPFVREAVGRLHRATGLHFRYAGRTSYIPQRSTTTGLLRSASLESATHVPFVIAWAYRGTGKGRSNLLTSFEAGVGSTAWRYSAASQLRISDAAVVVKRGHLGLRSGFGAGGTMGTLMLHELGHAVGLGHASGVGEVMYPLIGPGSPGTYAAGDRTGLHKVGAAAGCMTGPRIPA